MPIAPMTPPEAAAFAASLAGLLAGCPTPDVWSPERPTDDRTAELFDRLADIGWFALAGEPDAAPFLASAAVELGRALAPVRVIDDLLGGPIAVSAGSGDWRDRPLLARYADDGEQIVCATPDGLCSATADPGAARICYVDAWAVRELAPPTAVAAVPAARVQGWLIAMTGYLAGLVAGGYELALEHARNRIAFGKPLLAIGAVQGKLADVRMIAEGLPLAAAEATPDLLRYAGSAACEALANCHQAVGAIGFTLEFPLQRYVRRATALGSWNDVVATAFDRHVSPEAEPVQR